MCRWQPTHGKPPKTAEPTKNSIIQIWRENDCYGSKLKTLNSKFEFGSQKLELLTPFLLSKHLLFIDRDVWQISKTVKTVLKKSKTANKTAKVAFSSRSKDSLYTPNFDFQLCFHSQCFSLICWWQQTRGKAPKQKKTAKHSNFACVESSRYGLFLAVTKSRDTHNLNFEATGTRFQALFCHSQRFLSRRLLATAAWKGSKTAKIA